MTKVVAIIGAGAMGSAVGRRLVEHGCTVLAVLEGRSEASRVRARQAGMQSASLDEALQANYLLSIVPPSEAESVARAVARANERTASATPFVDCNAVSPETVMSIGAIVANSRMPFVDAGIIGPPPGERGRTVLYASGPGATAFGELNKYGLHIEVLSGPIGAASALKMSFAGMTKGVTGLCSAMILAATRAGAAEALYRELQASRPELLAWAQLQIPKMFPKAYRWVGEMEEIARFSGDAATEQIYKGIAQLYARIDADLNDSGEDRLALQQFLKLDR